MIHVVDYRAGNAPSVIYALERLGVPCRLAATAGELDFREIRGGAGACGRR